MMRQNRIISRGSFVAKSADGRKFTIHVSQEMIDVSDVPDTEFQRGDYILKSSSGKNVNRIEKGIYQIVEPELLEIRSDEPNAP